jgi:hypothetical protein
MSIDAGRRTQAGSDSGGSTAPPARRVRRIVRFGGHLANAVLDSAPGGLIVSSHPSNPMDSENLRTRCVILVSPGETPPQPLIDLLRDQSPRPEGLIRAEHPLLALARLAGLERDRRIRAGMLDGEWPPAVPEKSILVVVNREAWRDLNPLFSTIRELMPAVGIWVCTERIAIEIYAGDQTTGAPRTDAAAEPVADDAGPASAVVDTGAASSTSDSSPEELTEAELRDLLAHFDGLDDGIDDLDDELPSEFGGPPRS